MKHFSIFYVPCLVPRYAPLSSRQGAAGSYTARLPSRAYYSDINILYLRTRYCIA